MSNSGSRQLKAFVKSVSKASKAFPLTTDLALLKDTVVN